MIPNQIQEFQNISDQTVGMPYNNQIPPRVIPHPSGYLDSGYNNAFPKLTVAGGIPNNRITSKIYDGILKSLIIVSLFLFSSKTQNSDLSPLQTYN